ncbi:MAG TPA: lysophospholipid acyltransferase family protein [Kiritimatiellia bacterium]|nr:lysophospholipid acyltransferase family protein [Kiritimatiellia bacterium]
MKRRHPIRVKFETWLTRLAFSIIPRLPRRVVYTLSRILGYAAYRFSGRLRNIGFANLDLAFGDSITANRKREILKHSFQSFSLVLLDAFWFSRDSHERIGRHVLFDPAYEVMFREKPHVCLTAHYGNWEALGMAITSKGYPLHSVAKPLKNEEVDRLFIDARNKTGQKIVRREGAVRTLLRILKEGGKIGLVLDQNTKISEGGRFFSFFDVPVLVSTAAAGLAIKTNTDVILCMMKPGNDGIYRADYCQEVPISPYLEIDTDAAVDQLTAYITKAMEDYIRAHPDHWLWTYKRWKYIKPGDDPERYPFYRRKAV